MNYLPFMLFPVLIIVTIQYLLEVHAGGSISMYGTECGLLSEDYIPRKITSSQFLGIVAPLQFTAIGLPLLAYDLLSGILLVLMSLILFFRYSK